MVSVLFQYSILLFLSQAHSIVGKLAYMPLIGQLAIIPGYLLFFE